MIYDIEKINLCEFLRPFVLNVQKYEFETYN